MAWLLTRSYHGGSGANGECLYEVCPTPDNGTYVQKAPMPAEGMAAPAAAPNDNFTNVLTVHLDAEGALRVLPNVNLHTSQSHHPC
jgi:hypothetical protein